MALQLNDRVKEFSITTGVAPIVLTGALTGYQNVASSISTSNTFPYVVELVGGSEWEIGIGQYVSSNNSIIRTQILNSSNSSNIVNFSAGTKNVFISVPAAYMALTAKDLSQFSSTTSAELAGIISDKTGTGKLVFSNNAVLVTPSFSAANGTAPFSVVSNTNVSNLNADLLDGQHGTYYIDLSSAANTTAINAYSQANIALTVGQSAFGQANSAYSQANTGLTVGQAAFSQANTAYNTANTKFSANGGTVFGSVTITTDLNVNGNVYLGGNVTTLSSNNLSITDPLIYLAENNPANLQDIGIVGSFTGNKYQHTGIVRDATDGVWKLFSNVSAEPTTTIDFSSDVIYDPLKVGSIITSNAVFSVANGTVPFIVSSNTLISNLNVDLLDGQHGSYYTGLSNSANTQANLGISIGQGAFGQANTALTTGQNSFAQANAAYNKANTVVGGLTPTAIKTANGYVAVANDLVRCNTAAGAFSVTFPASPADGDIIGVVDVAETFSTNNLTLLPNGKSIEIDATSIILDMDGTYVSFVYNLSTSNWRLLETPLGTGFLPTRIISSSYTASINDIVRCNTAAGAFAVTLPADPVDGSIIKIIDIAGTFYANNLTIIRGGTNTIENDTSVILDINNTAVEFIYNTSTTNWRLIQTPIGSLGNVTANTSVTGMVKITGTVLANAVPGTDYLTPPSGTSILKANSNGALTNAVAGTDYLVPSGALGTPSSGTLSSCTVDGTNSVGYINIPQNSQSTAYTLVAADAGKHIFHPSTDANARTFTIPANGSVAYPIGTAISFVNMTSQVVSIAITTDAMYLAGTGTTGTRSLAQYGTATALKMTSTTWIISGAGLT